MRVAVVNPKLSKSGFNSMPQGVLSICATAKREGHECDIIDFNIAGGRIDDLRRYDVVGISVFTSQLPHAVQIADGLRGRTKLVWGGIHCLLDPLSVLERYRDSYVVAGEGEVPFGKLLAHFEGAGPPPGEIEGLCYVEKGAPRVPPPYFMKDVNAVADVNYYDLPCLERYIERDLYYFPRKLRTLEVVTGRGCLWNCTFCINYIFRRHKAFHRVKTMDKIRREVEPVIDDLGIEALLPRDDDFFADLGLVEQWARFTGEKGLLWQSTCRFNYLREGRVDAAMLRRLAGTGLYEIGMATEAGLESVRSSVINKKVSDADIHRAIGIVEESGADVVVNTSFIVYFPGDSPENRIAMIRLMDYLSKRINIVFSGPQVYRSYPGCKLYEMEGHHLKGDLAYYIDNMTEEGYLKTSFSAGDGELLFFSDIVKDYFNTRFRMIERSGRNGIRLTDRGKYAGQGLGLFYALAFLTIRLRLRYDFWRFFFEPFVIPRLFAVARRVFRLSRRKGKAPGERRE